MPMRCCVCREVAKTEEDLRVHITTRHVRYIPLECHHCDHVFLPTLHALTRHYRMVHPDKLPVAVATLSYDAEKATEVEELVAQSQSNADDGKSAAEATPMGKRKPQTLRLKKGRRRKNLLKKEEKSGKTQNDFFSEFDAINGESSRANLEEPKQDERQNQLEFWFDEKNEKTNELKGDQNNSLIESEIENELSSLMETADDISTDHYDQQKKGEKDDANNQNASTLESETTENGTTDDEDQPMDLKLYIDEKLHTTEEQPEQKPCEENDDDDIASSPPITNTSPPALRLSLSPLFRQGTGVSSTSKGRRGRKPYISKDCALCGKTSFKKSDKRELHVWSEHMPMNRYGCLVCPLVRTSRVEAMQLHSNRFHAGDMSIIEDAKEQELDLYNATRQEAFPALTAKSENPINTTAFESETENENETPDMNRTSSPTSVPTAEDVSEIAPAPISSLSPTATDQPLSITRRRSGPKGISKDCALCGMTSIQKTKQRERHIWSEHMRMHRFSCRLCPLVKVNRMAAIQNHASRYHPGELDVVQDAKLELLEQFNDIRLKAFPALVPEIIIERVKVEHPLLLCQLCAKTVPTKSKGQHVWGNHMQTRRYECALCNYTAAYTGKIKGHMWTKHPESIDLYTDRSQELHDEYKQNALLAFGNAPETPRSSTTDPDDRKMALGEVPMVSTCAMCGETPLRNEMAKLTHLWRKHMPRERFRCQRCPEMQTSRSDKIRLHIGRYHGGDMELLDDAKLELQQQYTDIRRQAFPVGLEGNEGGTPAFGRKRAAFTVGEGSETSSVVKNRRKGEPEE